MRQLIGKLPGNKRGEVDACLNLALERFNDRVLERVGPAAEFKNVLDR